MSEKGYFGKKLVELNRKRAGGSGFSEWEREVLIPWLNGAKRAERQTPSGIGLKEFYDAEDLAEGLPERLGKPGTYPFTRGIYPNMYRGKVWTMRMFSGYGTPEATNRRLKYLLRHGETGLSIAFDMPTLYGYDPDHPLAEGVVGVDGVNIATLADMMTMFRGIRLDRVSTSMTINAPAQVILMMYVATAKAQGAEPSSLSGTTQTDMLKEFMAQKEFVFPPEAHMRLIRDMMVYCTREMPKWNWISVSGYHIREAGANAVQEAAFTLANGFYYVELGISSGLNVDDFAPRISFFFDSGIYFFEEIAKFRAARRVWATVMKEKYGARNPRSLWLRFHTQTSGYTLTWQQPMNNIVRTAIEALAAVLGGTQSLHTNAYDEAYAVPTASAAKLALRTQQIIAEETGVPDVVDPLGGSYYVEWLTDEMEKGIYRYLDEIERIGGVIEGIKSGYFQREIARTAYEREKRLKELKEVMVGVNKYVERERPFKRFLRINPKEVAEHQIMRLRQVKENRDQERVRDALSSLRRAFERDDENAMPYILRAVESYATLQEIMDVGREIFGEWKEPNILKAL